VTPTHECPAPDCTVPCSFGTLACPRHWRMLPRHLKAAVTNAWRRGSWGEHADARAAAVTWWEAHT
jgi:hypothetical protein